MGAFPGGAGKGACVGSASRARMFEVTGENTTAILTLSKEGLLNTAFKANRVDWNSSLERPNSSSSACRLETWNVPNFREVECSPSINSSNASNTLTKASAAGDSVAKSKKVSNLWGEAISKPFVCGVVYVAKFSSEAEWLYDSESTWIEAGVMDDVKLGLVHPPGRICGMSASFTSTTTRSELSADLSNDFPNSTCPPASSSRDWSLSVSNVSAGSTPRW